MMSTLYPEEKAAARYQKPTQEELEEYKEIFDLVDVSGDGSISHIELHDLMKKLRINANAQEIQMMIGEIDIDG